MTMQILAITLVAFLLQSLGISAQRPSDSTKAIVQSYLEIQAKLAADKLAEVKGPAKALAAQAAALGKDGEAIARAATAVEAAADIERARDAFGPLSDAVIGQVRAEGATGFSDLRLAYCPMVKRSWLQREAQIRNPYYGAAMLGCGEFKPLSK
jgi:hypothetical protein